MKLDVLCLIFIGYFIQASEEGGGGGKHVHVKIHVPTLIHKHTHTVYKKVPVHHGGGHEKKHIVIHKHDHSHKHKHDHGHKHGHNHKHKHGHKHGHKHNAKHGHKHDHKHKHGHKHGHKHDHKHVYTPKKGHHDHGWYTEPIVNLEHQRENYDIDPNSYDDDGFKSSKKSVRSEHYEVQRRNPFAFPGQEVEVKGSYKVQETDPYDITTTSYQSYDSPVTKEIAQAITDFGRYQNEPVSEGNKESEDYTEAEGEGEGEGEGEAAADHEGVEEYDDNNELQNYEDYGDNTEVVQNYVADPQHGQLELGDRDYNYGSEHLEKYILRKVYGGETGAKY